METTFQNMQISMHIAFLVLLCSQLGSTRRVNDVAPSQGTGNPGGGSGRAGNQGINAGSVSGIGGGFGIGIGIGNGNGVGNGNGNGGGASGYGSGSGGLGLGIGIGIGVPVAGPSGEPLYCVPTNCPNGGNCARFWATFHALASNTTINNHIRPENSGISTDQRG